MGIEFQSVVAVGLPVKEITTLDGDWGDYCDDLGLYIISPYFDAPGEDCYAGIVLYKSAFGPVEVNLMSTQEKVHQIMQQFFEATGKQGKIFLSTHSF